MPDHYRPKLTAAVLAEAVRRLERGECLLRVARSLQVSRSSLNRYGLRSRRGAGRPRRVVLSLEIVDEARRRAGQGEEMKRIAEILGVSRSTLHRWGIRPAEIPASFWVEVHSGGMSGAEVARLLGKTKAAVYRMWNRLRVKGLITAAHPRNTVTGPTRRKRRRLVPYAGAEVQRWVSR